MASVPVKSAEQKKKQYSDSETETDDEMVAERITRLISQYNTKGEVISQCFRMHPYPNLKPNPVMNWTCVGGLKNTVMVPRFDEKWLGCQFFKERRTFIPGQIIARSKDQYEVRIWSQRGCGSLMVGQIPNQYRIDKKDTKTVWEMCIGSDYPSGRFVGIIDIVGMEYFFARLEKIDLKRQKATVQITCEKGMII